MTAEAVVLNNTNSLPLASPIYPLFTILGADNVLFDSVCVPPIVTISLLASLVPILTFPVPLADKTKSILLSSPEADIEGAEPVIALVTVISLTALNVVAKINSSLPLASAIKPPFAIFGAVNVLFVNVWVPDKVATVLSIVTFLFGVSPVNVNPVPVSIDITPVFTAIPSPILT